MFLRPSPISQAASFSRRQLIDGFIHGHVFTRHFRIACRPRDCSVFIPILFCFSALRLLRPWSLVFFGRRRTAPIFCSEYSSTINLLITWLPNYGGPASDRCLNAQHGHLLRLLFQHFPWPSDQGPLAPYRPHARHSRRDWLCYLFAVPSEKIELALRVKISPLHP